MLHTAVTPSSCAGSDGWPARERCSAVLCICTQALAARRTIVPRSNGRQDGLFACWRTCEVTCVSQSPQLPRTSDPVTRRDRDPHKVARPVSCVGLLGTVRYVLRLASPRFAEDAGRRTPYAALHHVPDCWSRRCAPCGPPLCLVAARPHATRPREMARSKRGRVAAMQLWPACTCMAWTMDCWPAPRALRGSAAAFDAPTRAMGHGYMGES